MRRLGTFQHSYGKSTLLKENMYFLKCALYYIYNVIFSIAVLSFRYDIPSDLV